MDSNEPSEKGSALIILAFFIGISIFVYVLKH